MLDYVNNAKMFGGIPYLYHLQRIAGKVIPSPYREQNPDRMKIQIAEMISNIVSMC